MGVLAEKKIWDEVFKLAMAENKKIIESGLLKPADIIEDQLKPILWSVFNTEGFISATEASYDSNNKRKKIDMVTMDKDGGIYNIEIKRNCLGLKPWGKTYSDSKDRYEKDITKLNSACNELRDTKKIKGKIFIEVQYFNKTSMRSYKNHKAELKEKFAGLLREWNNLQCYELGGPDDVMHSDEKGKICLAMNVWVSEQKTVEKTPRKIQENNWSYAGKSLYI